MSRSYTREQWASLRVEGPLSLSLAEISQLRGQIEPISAIEVTDIYLPLVEFLSTAINESSAPFVIGVTGSVAVGKSLSARLLQALFLHWPQQPKVDLVTTDGFLYSNAELERRNIVLRKGFPESFDQEAFLQFLSDLKEAKPNLKVPQYSHHSYDVLSDQFVMIDKPDIVIVEGLNVLQAETLKFMDFTVYVDAKKENIKAWFVKRFMLFREAALNKEEEFFYRFTRLSEPEAIHFAEQVWQEINEVNLLNNILPQRELADLILVKDKDHSVQKINLRR